MQFGIPGIPCITPAAAYIAASQSYEICSPAGIASFSLDGVEFFHQG
jgi:hypothetical protein